VDSELDEFDTDGYGFKMYGGNPKGKLSNPRVVRLLGFETLAVA
jgi:hypothetical protein